MKERITTRHSGDPVREDLTDWDRVRALTNDEIEQAISADPDCFALEKGEVPPFQGLIFRDGEGKWRWRLIGPDREPIADSPRGYTDRNEVDRALRTLRRAIVEAETKAKAA